MKATKLIVTAQETDSATLSTSSTYNFPVWEFENGLILVPSDSTNDWFFESRDEIEANGLAEIVEVEETETTSDWSVEDLNDAIEGSQSEFGEDSVPAIALELINA